MQIHWKLWVFGFTFTGRRGGVGRKGEEEGDGKERRGEEGGKERREEKRREEEGGKERRGERRSGERGRGAESGEGRRPILQVIGIKEKGEAVCVQLAPILPHCFADTETRTYSVSFMLRQIRNSS